MKTKTSLILHPLFILSVGVLFLNDHYLKYEYHNWGTGKLSDFTGLFSLAVALITIFPKQRKLVIICIALLFAWWKSILSSSFIIFCNYELGIPIQRTVDISDLQAVLALPLSLLIKPVEYNNTFIKKIAIACVCTISFIVFTATSLPRKLTHDKKVLLDKNIRANKKEEQIVRILEEDGLAPLKKEVAYEKTWDFDQYLKPKGNDSIMIPVDSLYEGIYRRIDYGSGYTIPKMYVANDSIYDLHLTISEHERKKTNIRLYSFNHKRNNPDSAFYNSFYLWKKFKKPIKKRIKKITRK